MENDILQINNPFAKLLPETIGMGNNDILTAVSPGKLHNMYRLGMINGVLIDNEKAPWHVRKFAEYNFKFLKDNQKDNQSIFFEETSYYDTIRGSSKGQRVLNYRNNLKIDKKAMSGEAQVTGDCVSHGTRAALDQLRCNRIASLGKWEAYIERQATAMIYRSRGYNGQGADSVQLSANAIEIGTLLEIVYKTKGGKTYDFTDYNKYVSWGMNGSSPIPSDLLELTKPYHAGTYKVVATTDGLADLLFNGGTCHCGSMLGVSSTGDPISRRSGSWSHDMNISGFDDTDWCHSKFGGRIWMWDQSWGDWNSVTNIPDEWKPISEGQFMLNDKDTQYAVGDGGCCVFFDGDFFHADPIGNMLI